MNLFLILVTKPLSNGGTTQKCIFYIADTLEYDIFAWVSFHEETGTFLAKIRAVTNHSAALPQHGSHCLNTVCENVNSMVHSHKQFIQVNILSQFL